MGFFVGLFEIVALIVTKVDYETGYRITIFKDWKLSIKLGTIIVKDIIVIKVDYSNILCVFCIK